MLEPIRGIHHITAIASDAQRNLDFYTQVLGLRLVKRTVNFDDPGTYHFYFGDAAGHPGTLLTFFPWGDEARRGRRGLGQVGVVSFNVPAGALGYWQKRLSSRGVTTSSPFQRFNAEVLTFLDPDGLQLELVAAPETGEADEGWRGSDVPLEQAIRGFGAPALLIGSSEATAALLVETFGLRLVAQSGPRSRYAAEPESAAGGTVDIEVRPDEQVGRMGAGVVHHIAWRAPDDAAQLAWREVLVAKGFQVTPVMDRQYFHSIYFRAPGGILFEIATDPPGFAIDEAQASLGMQLKLPEALEAQRAQLERVLPPVKLPVEAH